MYTSLYAGMAGIFFAHALIIPAIFKSRTFKWGWLHGIITALIYAGLWFLVYCMG